MTVEDFGKVMIACFVLSGVAAFFGLPDRHDGNIRMRAIRALTLGLFIGFSVMWTALAMFLRHAFTGDPALVVPYWGIEAGLVIASVLCGFMFAERSAHYPLSPNVTVIDGKWVRSPRRAFRSGITIGILTPTGIAALGFALWAVSTFFK